MITLAATTALFAATLCFVEAATSNLGLAWKAWPWISCRMGLDGAAGYAAYFPVSAAAAGHSFPRVTLVFIAGASGTAGLRSYCLRIGRGRDTRQIGLIAPYEKLRVWTDKNIADAVATAKANWTRNVLEPSLRLIPMEQIINDVCFYFDVKGMSSTKLSRLRSSFELEMNRAGEDERESRITVYRSIIAAGAISQLRSAQRRAKIGP